MPTSTTSRVTRNVPNELVVVVAEQLHHLAEWMYTEARQYTRIPLEPGPGILLVGTQALELYLKAFLAEMHYTPLSGRTEEINALVPQRCQKHRISSLWNDLHPLIRRNISEAFAEYQDREPFHVRPSSLQALLQRYETLVLRSRYFFEKDPPEESPRLFEDLLHFLWFFHWYLENKHSRQLGNQFDLDNLPE